MYDAVRESVIVLLLPGMPVRRLFKPCDFLLPNLTKSAGYGLNVSEAPANFQNDTTS